MPDINRVDGEKFSDPPNKRGYVFGLDGVFNDDTLEPYVILKVAEVWDGQPRGAPQTFVMNPDEAENLGINMTATARMTQMSVALLTFRREMREAGRDADADAIDHLMDWLGERDAAQQESQE